MRETKLPKMHPDLERLAIHIRKRNIKEVRLGEAEYRAMRQKFINYVSFGNLYSKNIPEENFILKGKPVICVGGDR